MSRPFRIRSGSDLGAALAEARTACGLTQAEVAEATGLDRSYLVRLEAGRSVQQIERALRVLRRLGAEVVVTMPDGGSSSRPA